MECFNVEETSLQHYLMLTCEHLTKHCFSPGGSYLVLLKLSYALSSVMLTIHCHSLNNEQKSIEYSANSANSDDSFNYKKLGMQVNSTVGSLFSSCFGEGVKENVELCLDDNIIYYVNHER